VQIRFESAIREAVVHQQNTYSCPFCQGRYCLVFGSKEKRPPPKGRPSVLAANQFPLRARRQRRQSQELVVDENRKIGNIDYAGKVTVTFSLTNQRRQGQELVVDEH
jgi:hypothetical protein